LLAIVSYSIPHYCAPFDLGSLSAPLGFIPADTRQGQYRSYMDLFPQDNMPDLKRLLVAGIPVGAFVY